MKCDCEKQKWKKGKITAAIRLAKQTVKVVDAPAMICENCGQFAIFGDYLLQLERKLLKKQPVAA